MVDTTFNVTVTGDRELIARIDAMPAKVRAAVLRKVTALALELEAKIKNEKLSGQVLHVRSGALRRSIFSEVQDNGSSIYGRAASSGDVKYAAAHEFGATIDIPEIVPTKAQALHFVMGGKDVFAKRVRAHSVTIPERSYMRSSLAEMKERIVSELQSAVREGLAP